jgi:hypothetical protein
MLLHAIIDFYGEPYEETCLCDVHYTENNKEWHNLSYPNARWREFEAEKTDTEYAKLSCTICGFPIGSEKESSE